MDAERTRSYVGRGDADELFAAPYLCLAFECERPLAPPRRWSIAEVERVAIGRGPGAAVRAAEEGVPTLALAVADEWMSTRHAQLERRGGGWHVVDLGSKNGTFRAGLPVRDAALADGDLLEIGSTLFLFRDAERRGYREPPDVDGAALDGDPAFATLAPAWARALAEVARLAASPVPLVLHGETGTGKEILARAIHARSGRGPFVALNCGALPEALVEGELFGHRKGAFSGATEDRAGLVRAADGGTLFLDEVGELPAAAQVKLLRVLQEGEVRPLGGAAPVAVDLRIVSASHRALPAEVAAGRFRADLLARLAGHTIELPPLRARREDLGLMIGALLRRRAGARAEAIRFERDAARALFRHDWPLNVRELDQALGAALALAADGRIGPAHVASLGAAASPAAAGPSDEDRALRAALVAQLGEHRGNLSAVARAMGKDRVQIRRWLRRFALDPDAYR